MTQRLQQMASWTRRETLSLLSTLGAMAIGAGAAEPVMADTTPAAGRLLPPAYRGEHQIKPLPFDAAKLNGLSEKLISSHHQNNYAGAVRRLNQIQQQLGTLPPDAAPYQMGSLKREEIIAANSMILHELYFGNLGSGGGGQDTFGSLATSHYGSREAWEHDFRLTGLSLAGGSGWVIVSYDPVAQTLHNYWAWDHTHSLATGVPVLVMDMYEHAYHMDYGANAKGYVDAFLQNVRWDEVDRRIRAAAPSASPRSL